MITLTEQEVNDLINFANEMPTKYGMPLISFMQSKQLSTNEIVEKEGSEKTLEEETELSKEQ